MPGGLLTREALVFKALCILDEAMEQARRGRVPASLGLRFALAFLYAVGDRRGEWFDRQPYDTFWREATQRQEDLTEGHNVHAYGRVMHMTASMNAIARAAGMPLEIEVLQALRRARAGERAA